MLHFCEFDIKTSHLIIQTHLNKAITVIEFLSQIYQKKIYVYSRKHIIWG